MKMFDLTGRVAFVTGGNGGIGLGIAKGLASAGAAIVVAARDEAKTANAVEELRHGGASAEGIPIDVGDESSVQAAVGAAIESQGRIDILVNNAGMNIRKRPEEYELKEWSRIIDVNLTGAFLCSQAAYPHLAAKGGGKLINIASMFSLFGSDWVSAYAASKGGLVQLTKSLAIAWAKDNIQVNAILPGWIETDLTGPIRANQPERVAVINTRIPSGRWGKPDDLAGAAVFLASSASDYVTGASVAVDGGYSVF